MTTVRELTVSEQQWLRVRKYLQRHRHELAVRAAADYPDGVKLAGTPLLTPPHWRPAAPMPLGDVKLTYQRGCSDDGFPETVRLAAAVLPERADGTPYRRYSDVVSELAAPAIFEDRPTYRLLDAELTGSHAHLAFGLGSYFDGIDTGDAAAHEFASTCLGLPSSGVRAAIGDPCAPNRRPVNVAITTMTLRHDRNAGRAWFLLHWRDPSKVGHAGGMYQVVPVGVFQPSSPAPWNESNDFSLWRCMIREFAEELRGRDENYGSDRTAIDYDHWPFARQMTGALATGEVRAYCLGLGVDPLTFATDLLTVVVIDAPLFDEMFGDIARDNTEGTVLDARPFDRKTVDDATFQHPMQAAGAALVQLAWRHRAILVG